MKWNIISLDTHCIKHYTVYIQTKDLFFLLRDTNANAVLAVEIMSVCSSLLPSVYQSVHYDKTKEPTADIPNLHEKPLHEFFKPRVIGTSLFPLNFPKVSYSLQTRHLESTFCKISSASSQSVSFWFSFIVRRLELEAYIMWRNVYLYILLVLQCI